MIAVFITLIGYVAMTVGSSPTVKGASFIWLPAALQLVAGVWLGPWLGLLAGGLGAYAAGILAYGGWGIVDIIMNPIAGGVANAMLPAILFRMYRVDPTLGAQRPADVLAGVVKAVVLAIVVLVAGRGSGDSSCRSLRSLSVRGSFWGASRSTRPVSSPRSASRLCPVPPAR